MNAAHHHYMSLALNLAEKGRFTVSPNPMVGCVIVKDNNIIGCGYHQRAGEAHAEIIALKQAKEQSVGATAYITLEPCCHEGKTPPCITSLISAGIKCVYVACIDPNPLVMGKGIDALRKAGIQVEVGICGPEAHQLNEIFFHFIKQRRPFVIAKWAMSLDGKTITNPHDDKQISGEAAQEYTHQLRHQVDAILVGSHTACYDNPQLTARFDATLKQPIRIILAGKRPLPTDLRMLTNQLPNQQKTIIATTTSNKHLFADIIHKDVEMLALPEDEKSQISLQALLFELGKRDITSLLVEGGMTVHESFFSEKLVDKVHVYISPVFIGSLDRKQPLDCEHLSQLGNDYHFTAKLKEIANV